MVIKVSKGAPGHAAGLFGAADGKGAKAQTLMTGQKSTLAPGDTMSRAMGQYGKGHSYLAPGEANQNEAAASDPQAHPGMSNPGRSSQIKGGAGGIRTRPSAGGIGETKATAPTVAMGD